MDQTVSEPERLRVVHLARERPFRLGAVEVRPATREVIGPRGRTMLEPQVMRVLVALAQANGEILTRDDLTERCWDSRIVGEDAISRVISRLRRASQSVGRGAWTLETVTKVGYRLLPADGTLAEPAEPAAQVATPTSRRTILLAGGAAAVATAIGGGIWWRIRRPSPRARLLYQKGREALRIVLPESNAQAQGFLREAVGESPDFAPAWGALAIAYQQSLTYTEPARQPGVAAQAQAAARRALDIDPDDADALAAIALLAPVWRNWSAAERAYQRALTRHARDGDVAFVYARLLLDVGRIRECVAQAQASVADDEFAVRHQHTLALALWSAGRQEEADRVLAKALDRWPRHYALWFLQLALLTYTGRADRALAMGEDLANRPINIPTVDIEVNLKTARALATRAPGDIEAAAQANFAAARRGIGYAENAVHCLSALGHLDEAFAVARAMYFDEGFTIPEQRFSSGRFEVAGRRKTYILFTPPTAALRADPRFRPLLRDVGLVAYWRTSGRPPDDRALAT